MAEARRARPGRLLAACLALAGAAAPAAEPPQANTLRAYSYEQGLPQASVNAMLQSRDRFLWIGTFGGLARFDGREFRVYGPDDADGGGPGSARILALHEDGLGRLWVGTQEAGISLFERGRFRQLPVCGGACQVNQFVALDERELWVLSTQGVYRVDLQTLQATRELDEYNAFDWAVAHGGALYAGGRAGLWRLSPRGSERLPLPDGHGTVRRLEANADAVWVIVESGTLYRYAPSSGAWTRIRGGLPSETQLAMSGDGRLYISDETAGLRELAADGRESPVDGAQSLHARLVLRDDEGNAWIGTTGQGLWRLRPSTVAMVHGPQARAPGRSVAGDGRGGLWLGFGCSGLWHRAADGTTTPAPAHAMLSTACISGLLSDPADGALWIGTSTAALGRLHDGRLEEAWSWPREGMLGVWRAADGGYWAVTLRHVYRLDVAGGRVLGAHKLEALAGAGIAKMVDARAGGVWFVGERGVFRVAGDRVVERWTAEHGLPAFSRDLHEDADGGLWVGSYGGGLTHVRDGRVHRYTTADGLFDDTVSCILPDRRGRLWLAGNHGLSVLLERPAAGAPPRLRTLGASDGLDPPEFNGGTVSACHAEVDGRMWFAMIRGFASVDPERLDPARRPPPTAYLDRVSVSGREIDPFDPPPLGVDASNLEIDAGAISFTDAQRLRFRYRVGGEAGTWVETSDSRSILLPALPWGRLRFEVQARHLDGDWSPSAELRLDRPVPWYRREWIWLAASLAALICVLRVTRERHEPPVP
ncbi:hypothetical protein LDO32_10310 [Luteimonas sp. Y-2-2-4F]|nr:two-component regulator propeller domain-containing protein [Luteimonas sp. Y-2-2-4F]MCD9032114.1 hypothetical protein [Luteimonas sp. Y-2-2-4F]